MSRVYSFNDSSDAPPCDTDACCCASDWADSIHQHNTPCTSSTGVWRVYVGPLCKQTRRPTCAISHSHARHETRKLICLVCRHCLNTCVAPGCAQAAVSLKQDTNRSEQLSYQHVSRLACARADRSESLPSGVCEANTVSFVLRETSRKSLKRTRMLHCIAFLHSDHRYL